MDISRVRTWGVLLLCLASSLGLAAERPEIAVHRGEAPVVDGRLDDAVWQKATATGDFLQYEPKVGAPMTERTEFRLMSDGATLFVGIWCYDREPDAIVARKMLRDGNIFSDDYIYFAIDTFLDRRNSYIFSLNPNGTRYDALGTDNTSVDSNWDGFWTAKTSIDDEGWKAEIAIPLHTLSFDPDTDRWGFNMSRMIRRKNERGRWHRALPQLRTSMMSEAGDLSGLGGLKPGLGLQVSPYITARVRQSESGNESWLGDVGGDIRYQFTPSLNGTLSLNTDFAETEVDQRQLNFGRFPLFFPEKRDFFLEDQSAFQFGGVYNRNYGFRSGALPFFSRRIGRDEDGAAQPVRLAAKVSGRAGPWSVGLLDAWVDDDGDDRNLFVGRVSREIGQASSAGVIATWGDPLGDRDTGTFGGDVRFRRSDFLGSQVLEGSAFALATTDGDQEEDGDGRTDEAFGAVVSFPNDLLFLSGKFLQVGEHFNPALGFVPRQGIRGYATNFSYEPRPNGIDWLRQYKMSVLTENTTDLDNDLESAEYTWFPLTLDFESGEEFNIKVERDFDAPDEAFSLFDKIEVAADDYWWTRYEVEFETARKHPVQTDIEYSWGDFYDGKRQGVDLSTRFALSKHFYLNLSYNWDKLAFDQRDLEVHNGGVRGIVNWTPDLSLVNFLQYDSESEQLGWYSRLQWEQAAGRKFFAVFNQSYLRDDGSFAEQETEAVVKFGTSWWF